MTTARTQLDSRHLGVSYLRYAPNLRAVMGHRHSAQEEAYVVVVGGRVLLDGAAHELISGTLCVLHPLLYGHSRQGHTASNRLPSESPDTRGPRRWEVEVV